MSECEVCKGLGFYNSMFEHVPCTICGTPINQKEYERACKTEPEYLKKDKMLFLTILNGSDEE